MREKGFAVRAGDLIVLASVLTFTKELVDETVDIIFRSLFEISKDYAAKMAYENLGLRQRLLGGI